MTQYQYYTIVIFLLYSGTFGWPGEREECLAIPEARLQMVFVLDRSYGNDRNYLKGMSALVSGLAEDVVKNLPGSQFGVASFLMNKKLNSSECYVLHQPLTRNLTLLKQKADIQMVHQYGDDSGSVRAVIMAAVDSNMGWIQDQFDEHGKLVRKVIVFITDEQYVLEKFDQTKKPAVGDMTDDCLNTNQPNGTILLKVLNETQTGVVAVIGGIASWHRSNYAGWFKKRPYLPYHDADLGNGTDAIPYIYKTFIREYYIPKVLCYWADPPAYNVMGL